jgi:hypothetical protein
MQPRNTKSFLQLVIAHKEKNIGVAGPPKTMRPKLGFPTRSLLFFIKLRRSYPISRETLAVRRQEEQPLDLGCSRAFAAHRVIERWVAI